MKLYQATTNMPCGLIPYSQTLGTCRIPITKTRAILSIGVLANGHDVSKREKAHGNNEADRNGARRSLRRLLLCESREGLNLELLDIYMTEHSWKELTQNWGSPDALWEGHLLDEDYVPRPVTSNSSSSTSLLQRVNHTSGPVGESFCPRRLESVLEHREQKVGCIQVGSVITSRPHLHDILTKASPQAALLLL
ncbi:hypothetical protein GJ744_007030 [Endocarpon pusillum]|uniref:Uncharacterized protein n=1 Tax=Endocarpon pusillum TaxID=364733 RepID=A0A8H7E7V2_9EURO|nr:hypothetical protein GJ744_007030 [Endocarpon pusillum]